MESDSQTTLENTIRLYSGQNIYAVTEMSQSYQGEATSSSNRLLLQCSHTSTNYSCTGPLW